MMSRCVCGQDWCMMSKHISEIDYIISEDVFSPELDPVADVSYVCLIWKHILVFVFGSCWARVII